MGSFATVNTDMRLCIFVGLPEDLVVLILKRLPIKSLIRFTCVSKRWRLMILSDPNFAKSQFQIASEQQTLSRRAIHESDCESLDFEKPMDFRKVRCPFKQPGLHVRILCSCNGLVFAASSNSDMYIWNPSTGFFKKLPDPGALPSAILWFYGFGYVSTIDDYKVIISFDVSGKKIAKAMVFSSRAKSWKTIEVPYHPVFYLGNLFNEALHWRIYLHGDIVAFDLAKEQFRTMSLPASLNYHHGGVHISSLGSVGGCLCVIIQKNANDSCIDLWVMREYEVADSWTKLYNLKFSDQREWIADLRPVLATETSTFLEKWSHSYRGCKCELIRIGLKEEKIETYMVRKEPFYVIAYEESLLWLND
ncbi:putative F-box domain, galactose oxidase/kelch, beta-propeller, F-box associated interaction [Rosa chinensis]|uniref:Putative F-box domain, galactose oxidase/kelch, beta-propeller, F-box associated interaction n=1 Tax=Rosa chinensis TaxID=74649 RepID=A0A2P6QHF1_ROSCH|nr:F-box protein CPR1 [Rosa chinensis]PRQ33615.1 putative F-box domain, galactose oxidase/kelch, beta-propeller, F-box associated interaction [Rosa chinensis]